ncbi:hypothetical protein PS15m_006763 [Mucor circinelloides]
MAKKTKKGYLWIFDQQDKWDEIASDKISQLKQMQATHLDWFDNHSTVSELLALRRPDLKRKHAFISTTSTNSQIVPNEDSINEFNAHDFSESMDIETLDEKHTKESVKPVETQSIDIDTPIANKTIITTSKQTNKGSVNQTTTNKADATENQAEHVHKTNTITIPPSKVKPTALIRPYTALTAQLEKPKTRSVIDDYDEEADQVQIVVSARKPSTETKEKPRLAASPPRQPQVSKSTPTKTFSLSHVTPSIPTSNSSTYRSAFMNKLFKTSRPSLKTAALPTASISTSSATTHAAPPTTTETTTATSPHKDSHSNHPVIITKRSSTASVRSASSNIHSTPIQASEIMPEPRFKRFKASQKKSIDPPVVVQTHDLSTVEEVDEPSRSQSQIQSESQNQTECQSQKENQDQNSQEDTPFATPTWAEGANLLNELKKQSTMNPDEIFGYIQPVDVQGKYAVFCLCV